MRQNPGTVTTNRKARRDYAIEEAFEAGIELCGTEVKSIREGKVNINDCFAKIVHGEVFVYNMHISPYEQGNRFNHDAARTRKLLLHKQEIVRLIGLVERKGYSLIPLRMYFKKSRVKVELAIGKGKKLFDKRDDIKKREDHLDMERALKSRNR